MTQEQLKELLQDMSLEEKIFQLVQVPGSSYEEDAVVTGNGEYAWVTDKVLSLSGSTLGIFGAEKLQKIQERYLEKQPHGIPLLFMLDVIHGYKTVFPCPLAQGAAFSPDIAEKCAEAAAREAAVSGIHVTFAPMADLVRDARWGRVMESTGEDPFLNGQMAAAMVRGFQGEHVGKRDRVAACVKHFAAYGAAVAGLDYQNAELSEHTLREFYLPAYKAAVDAGCEMAMTSFNTWNGIPSSGNKWLMRQVLREEMGFDGVLISDWAALGEMVIHGFCEDNREAAKKAMEAGVDIEMCTPAYCQYLEELVKEGELSEELIDRAVYRVLNLKNRLGLFENPYKDGDAVREQTVNLCREHRELARKAVRESLVLLKNDAADRGKLLPLDREKKIAFVGPYVKNHMLNSSWAVTGEAKDNVTVERAAKEAYPEANLRFAQGCTLLDNHTILNLGEYEEENWKEKNEKLLEEALECAAWADIVVLCLGEERRQSGEAASKTQIDLPSIQMELLSGIAKVNGNIVTVLFNGRPLDLRRISKLSKAIVEAWLPGTEGGHGVMDVLSGAYNPSGKLSMSFPFHVGQAPVYYNSYRSGRPKPEDGRGDYTSRYLDAPNDPLYVFGYGLSYTDFSIGPVSLSAVEMKEDETITASVTIRNTGDREGCEVLQLYLQDTAASRVRPVKELKGFRKVTLLPGEEKQVSFEITEKLLRFHTVSGAFASEPGKFRVWIANSSRLGKGQEFTLCKKKILYREITAAEMNRELFSHFSRRQVVVDCYRKSEKGWQIRQDPFVDDWSEEDYAFLVECLLNTIRTGGLVYGAFRGKDLKGFVSVEAEFLGSRKQYLDLSAIHVSEDMRHMGIGKRLFARAKEWAGERGARKLYISAHSAVETQAFYRALGCVDAEEPNEEHMRREPYDCQLECDVKKTR